MKEVRERPIPYDFTYMWNLKTQTNKTEIESQTQRRDWWLP